ncbi:sigma-70 family RNA polymerase sigma factor [Solirubrobacter sp. CPCC 204708]|uniref:Sigma-70 family RNA polymerase sigma factor n=1 Tax=Solirubrobacter deserti TaxID=2282478 RepID=A0ABT4RJZ1_9ACTN|nr:sigma-70 family RNA polymerase sigma factor [Solirubrobacter deserti]MBE2315793.1 sigma-70 family RNA polymerase sigma factor [Solirubrobacter deserti]MDA0138870.1 sigma-70 family RNA polymerase sigma factor [Solirubrobacter deserti]
MHDEAQLEKLHREHAGAVRAFVRRRVGDEDADDVVADVFVVAWRRLGDVPDDPRTWLLGVARKLLANRFRTAKRQRALYERLAREAERRPAYADGPSMDETGTLLRALASLRARDREVLLLVTWDGLSHAEAAQVLGVRPATLTMRVHRARRRLERAIEPTAPPDAAAPTATPAIQPSSSGA